MKGLSQITGAVMVLAVGVSLVSIYGEWAPDFAENMLSDAAEQSDNRIKCSNAAVDIEEAEYDITGQKLDFFIENTGTIRLSKGLHAGAFNSSEEIGRTRISSLEVNERRKTIIRTDRIPDRILVSSIECPDLRVQETDIDVSR